MVPRAEGAAHIEKTWERGQAYVNALRKELGDDADDLVPLVKGGVNLSKLRSLMHDTCNTANSTAREIAKLVEEKGRRGASFMVMMCGSLCQKRSGVCSTFCAETTRVVCLWMLLIVCSKHGSLRSCLRNSRAPLPKLGAVLA